MKTAFALAFMTVISAAVFGQSFRTRTLTTDDGLSQSFVFCIQQDTRGFMWFGTKDGLNRYDGYTFKVYRNNPDNINSIPNDFISALLEDKSGILWIGTALGGLCSYNFATGRFRRYQHEPSNPGSVTSNRISSLYEDGDGNLWIGTAHGLNEMDPLRRHVIRFLHDPANPVSISDDDIHMIGGDKDGNLWVATGDGVDLLKHSSRRFSCFKHIPGNTGSPASSEFESVLSAADGSMWFGTATSLEHYVGGKFVHYVISDSLSAHGNVTQIVQDRLGRLWLMSNFSLVLFNPKTSYYRFVDRKSSISSIYVDRTGTLWFGINGVGVGRFPTKGNRFELYRDERIEEVMFGPLISRLDKFTGIKFAYPNIHGQSFAEDKDENLWISTLFDGIFYYNARDRTFRRYQYMPSLRRDDDRRKVFFPYVGPDGAVWIGTQFGVARLNRRTGKFHYYRLYSDNYRLSSFERLSGSYNITCMLEDSSGVLWVGTPALGLIEYDPADGSRKYYSHRQGDSTGLSSSFILSIEPDPREPSRYLWIGTDGGGMNRFDKQTGRAQHFDLTNGLPNDVVYGILADRAGDLWLSTNRGLCRFDPRTHAVRVFDVDDGLQSNEFNRREFFQMPDGKMYFGGIAGVNGFYPDRIRVNEHVPPIVITRFTIFGKTVVPGRSSRILNRPITMADTVTVNYRDNALSFRFAALDYSEPRKNRYSYKLEGFDRDWIMSGTNRNATYTNLDPGVYLLRVRGSNSDGVWNMKGTSVVLIVKPPFWMTAWFKIVVGILLFLIVAGGARYLEMRKIRDRTRKLEQEAAIERERLRISKDMHDDIGSRLTQISLLSNLAGRDGDKFPEVADKLEDISSAATEIVTAFDEIVWAVNPRYDTVPDVMEYLAEFGTGYLENAGIDCHIDIPAVDGQATVPAEVRHNIFMVAKEALNNIVKYAGAAEAWIGFSVNPGQMAMTIRDNGAGFEEEEVRKYSEGLRNMKKRMEEVGGTCEITSRRAGGTTVSAVIPLKGSRN